MKKHKIYQPIYQFHLNEHGKIKDKLIKLLMADVDKIETSRKDCNDPDNMTMLDLYYSSDMTRKWVKYFKPFWILRYLSYQKMLDLKQLIMLKYGFRNIINQEMGMVGIFMEETLLVSIIWKWEKHLLEPNL